MEKRYRLEPEAPGELGERTELVRDSWPPTVNRLHVVCQFAPADDLVWVFPCFLIAAERAADLRAAGLTGVDTRDVEVTKASEFDELSPDAPVPDLLWLDVDGVLGSHDFAIDGKGNLVVSARALKVLRAGRLDDCGIEEL